MTDKNDTPQEIDLLELFLNISKWFSKQINLFTSVIMQIMYFFLRNIVWFIISIIIGSVFGFSFHKIASLYYHTEMVAYSHTISNSEAIREINNWNYSQVFTKEQQNSIKDIHATYLLDINNDSIWDIAEDFNSLESMDTAIMNKRIDGYFSIIIEVYDTSMISKIKESVFSHLSNNKRVSKLNRVRIKQQQEIIPRLKKEISDLDSLKHIKYFNKNKPTNIKLGETFLMVEIDTVLYHRQIIALVKQLQDAERLLYLEKEPFEIILDFSVPAIEDNDLINTIIYSIKIFFLIGLIIVLFFDQRELIHKQIKKAKSKR